MRQMCMSALRRPSPAPTDRLPRGRAMVLRWTNYLPALAGVAPEQDDRRMGALAQLGQGAPQPFAAGVVVDEEGVELRLAEAFENLECVAPPRHAATRAETRSKRSSSEWSHTGRRGAPERLLRSGARGGRGFGRDAYAACQTTGRRIAVQRSNSGP
jgi:hypothetical protein